MVKINPRGVRVLVKPDALSKKEGEILLPSSTEQEQKAVGTVIAIGNKVKDLKVKDRVIYGKYSGEQVKMGSGLKEEEFVILEADPDDIEHDHILAILKD